MLPRAVGAPPVGAWVGGRTGFLLKRFWLHPGVTNSLKVPPQQKVTPPLVDLSLAFPPETPRGELAPCPCCCGGKILISTESIALGSACEVAVITTSVVRPLLFPLFRTGTELGALYSPVVE